MTRRELVGTLAGAAGMAAAMQQNLSAQQYEIGSTSIKLGIASYSFRKFDREKAIAMTKEIGTPYLNVKDVHLPLNSTREQIDAAKKEFADAGITLVGCGNVSFQKDDEADIRAKFEYAKMAGFPLIVCAPTHETLPKLEKYVKEYNIKIAVHPHGPEDKHFPSPQSALAVVKHMDPRCGVCLDIGHATRAGSNMVESIVELGPRLLDMHVKDLKDTSQRESQCDVGDGKLPFPQIFLQLIKMKYQGYVNLEYEIHDDNPMPGMLKSFSYMRGVLAGIRAAKYA